MASPRQVLRAGGRLWAPLLLPAPCDGPGVGMAENSRGLSEWRYLRLQRLEPKGESLVIQSF